MNHGGTGEHRARVTAHRRARAGLACALVVLLAGCSAPSNVDLPAVSPTHRPSTGEPARASTPPAPTPAHVALPTRIVIPRIGVDAALVRLGLEQDGTLEVPTKAKNAGWFTDSPRPGTARPRGIAGHVHWSGIDAVFARLTILAPGDRVVIERADGTSAAFAVDRVQTYPKSRFPTALVYGGLAYAGLRLITCGGYDATARAYEANVIVFAILVTE